MAHKKVPTGDQNCPPHIRSSKRIYRKIIQATDGSDGESDLNSLGINAGDHDDEQEEEEEDGKDKEQIEFGGEALGDDSPGGFDDSIWAEGEMVTVAGSALPRAGSTVAVAGLRAAVGGF